MDALALLRDQAAAADSLMTQVAADITAEQASWHLDGSTANPIGATLLHISAVEDRAVQRFQGQPPLLEAAGWGERLGYGPGAPWSPETRPDPDACRAYAAEVRAATARYLAGLDPAELAREVDSSRGRRSLANLLTLVLVLHKLTHTGEIAALLGCQGVRGFPF
ncbi:MAG TPA: DinB family protein [Thermomicrobiales bacterium]|nr:DinB family protein [Thermomicrobiales bacterium]